MVGVILVKAGENWKYSQRIGRFGLAYAFMGVKGKRRIT
jgi:hypothetical protein